MHSRRTFLGGLGAAAGLVALGAPQIAKGALQGSSVACGIYDILEIFLFRGWSHRDAVWVDDPAEGWAPWRVEPDMADVEAAAAGATKILHGSVADHDVYLGAGFSPLLGHDALDHLRIVTLSHTFPEHGLASALALTGVNLGRTGFASLGARINARWGPTDIPSSVVVDANRNGLLTSWATAPGVLGAENRPLVVPMGSNGFKEQLDRALRTQTDPLVDLYRDRYAALLTHDFSGRVRSGSFDTYSDAIDRMEGWEALHDLIASPDAPTLEAGTTGLVNNRLTAGITFAGHLLANGVRHVCVLGGEAAHPSFDTHDSADYAAHGVRHNGLVYGVAKALRGLYDDGLITTDTLVVLHGEFGRQNLDDNGSEHQPNAYPAVVIGGPVPTKGIAGRIDFSTNNRGVAVDPLHPTDFIAALSLPAGIEPFQDGMFELDQLSIDADDEDSAKDALITSVFGLNNTECNGNLPDDVFGG